MPKDYKLFQVADLLCSIELVRLKYSNNVISKSELMFFGNIMDFRKNYLKPLSKKRNKPAPIPGRAQTHLIQFSLWFLINVTRFIMYPSMSFSFFTFACLNTSP